jgi:hypothetical protein
MRVFEFEEFVSVAARVTGTGCAMNNEEESEREIGRTSICTERTGERASKSNRDADTHLR